MEVKKELENLKEQSFAMEMLSDYKKQNKRLFWIWGITFLALMGLLCYTIYLLNDFTNSQTIDIQDVETMDNSNIKIGDIYGENYNN